MSIIIHSAVLRGEKARFQLFGDTVNTASRMESTGISGRIQVSQKTADQLIAAGKEAWLMKRAEMVEAKGKGSLTTYWLSQSCELLSAVVNDQRGASEADTNVSIKQREINTRLVEWNVEVFTELLQKRLSPTMIMC
jgi:Adenylate and Guanylate cyclase catalytic domain